MINQPLLETLGLTLLSEKHITVASYISCELHSVKIDKQRTSKPMEGQHTVYNIVMYVDTSYTRLQKFSFCA